MIYVNISELQSLYITHFHYLEKNMVLQLHDAYVSLSDPMFHFGNICTIPLWTENKFLLLIIVFI